MARKQQSDFDTLVMLVTRLPPWVGLVLAALSFIVLHQLSKIEVAPAADIADMGNMVGTSALRMFGLYGQLIFPIGFLLGAIGSYWKRRKGATLVKNIQHHGQSLDSVSWREFEFLVTAWLQSHGFNVVDNAGIGADGGKDQIFWKDGKKYLVQCKHWRAQKVGVSVIREMFGLLVAENAHEAWIVTSGSFTKEARDFASNKALRLIDGQELRGGSGYRPAPAVPVAAVSQLDPAVDPTCPQCAAPMKKRIASKGASAGQPFWGCSKFPQCRGTRDF